MERIQTKTKNIYRISPLLLTWLDSADHKCSHFDYAVTITTVIQGGVRRFIWGVEIILKNHSEQSEPSAKVGTKLECFNSLLLSTSYTFNSYWPKTKGNIFKYTFSFWLFWLCNVVINQKQKLIYTNVQRSDNQSLCMATCVLYLFATVNSFLDRCSENEAVETTRSPRFALLQSCLAVFASGKHEFDRLWDRSGMSVWVMVCLPDLNCAQFTLSSFKALNKWDSFSLADRQNTSSLGYLIFVK